GVPRVPGGIVSHAHSSDRGWIYVQLEPVECSVFFGADRCSAGAQRSQRGFHTAGGGDVRRRADYCLIRSADEPDRARTISEINDILCALSTGASSRNS